MDNSIIFSIGIILGLVMDVTWWRIPYQKVEAGFEVLEHYHFAIILGMFTVISGSPIFAGMMVALFLGEWTQDHKFAMGSSHFRNSTIIGGILFAMLLAIEFGGSLIGL